MRGSNMNTKKFFSTSRRTAVNAWHAAGINRWRGMRSRCAGPAVLRDWQNVGDEDATQDIIILYQGKTCGLFIRHE